MRSALKTLPWVEQSSVVVDVPSKKVTFNVKDKGQFDLKQVDAALKERSFEGCKLISGPENPAKKS